MKLEARLEEHKIWGIKVKISRLGNFLVYMMTLYFAENWKCCKGKGKWKMNSSL